jgi:hypothetical protein
MKVMQVIEMYTEPGKCPMRIPRDKLIQDLSLRFGCLLATFVLVVAILTWWLTH